MNRYIQLIKLQCIDNKYTKWYIKLIESRANRPKNRKLCLDEFGYVEAHHIFPSSLCMEDSQRFDKENLVFLTYREHIIAHLLLYKMFADLQSKYKMGYACIAFNRMSHEQLSEFKGINSRTKELLRIAYSQSIRMKYIGEGNPFYGKTHSEESLLKMRKPRLFKGDMGKHLRTDETKNKISAGRMGKCMGELNPMSNPDNVNKVKLSKIGKRKAINLHTNVSKMVYPDNVPDGYILVSELSR